MTEIVHQVARVAFDRITWVGGLIVSQAEQWQRPAPGTLRRGWIWVRSPRVVVGVLLAIVVLTIAASIRHKWRRRSERGKTRS